MNNQSLSIKEQRDLKRQAKLERRDDTGRRRKMQRWWLWGGSLVGLAAIIGVMVYLAQPPATNSDGDVLGLQADDHILGPATAPAVLIEYSDLQCPACKAYQPLVKQLHDELGDQLTIAYRHFPLRQIHRHAQLAAQAAEAAAAQGKFWEYHDLLFDRQSSWAAETSPRQTFLSYAEDTDLDVDRFGRDLDSSAMKSLVDADFASGSAANVQGTPTFFLNGQRLTNPATFEDFKKLIDDAIKNRPLTQVESTKFHAHADIRVLVDGQAIDFSQAKYQSTKDKELNPKVHFHSNVGKVFHVHEAGATLDDLFTSVGMKLIKDSFTSDDGKVRSASNTQVVKLFVNGQENVQYGDYQPKDLDRIVVIVGAMAPAELTDAVDSVTDEACIYSEKCPERGTPPNEECVGGLGTDCT